MSYSKRVLFGDDPADDAARIAIAASAARTIDEFRCKIPMRRKNRLSTAQRWDPVWPNSVTRAAKELGIDYIQVNDQICTRTREEAARVKEKAELLWEQGHAELAEWRSKRR